MNLNENKQNQDTGLNCPRCDFKIKFTMQDLLTKKEIVCPSCNLEMQMNVPAEMKKHLQEISLAEKMVKESSKFSR